MKDSQQTIPCDQRWMESLLRFGLQHTRLASPNPSVAAMVLNPESYPVGYGITAKGGRPHAEYNALKMAGSKAEGGTMYVTLEPCCHEGRGPACLDLILKAKLKNIVIGCYDADPRTCGKSVDKLTKAGLNVRLFAIPEAARASHIGHFMFHRHHRPLITGKLALSQNDRYASTTGAPVAITGTQANRISHSLRAESDAILVSAKTWNCDQPKLTCRLPGLIQRSPRIIILHSKTKPLSELLIKRPPTDSEIWVVTDDKTTPLPRPYKALPTKFNGKHAGLKDLLSHLADLGIRRLLVEGGAHLLNAFIQDDLMDRFWLWQSSRVHLDDKASSVYDFKGLKALCQNQSYLMAIKQQTIKHDTLTQFHSPMLKALLAQG